MSKGSAGKGRGDSNGRRGGGGGGGGGGGRHHGGGHRRGRSSSEARATINRDEIREWVEARRGKPACARGTGGRPDPGMLRIDFPGYSGQELLQEISWNEWFRSFDHHDLAFIYQDRTADGAESRFNKLVSRAEAGIRGGNGQRGNAHSHGSGGGRPRSAGGDNRRSGGGSGSSRHSSGGRPGGPSFGGSSFGRSSGGGGRHPSR